MQNLCQFESFYFKYPTKIYLDVLDVDFQQKLQVYQINQIFVIMYLLAVKLVLISADIYPDLYNYQLD